MSRMGFTFALAVVTGLVLGGPSSGREAAAGDPCAPCPPCEPTFCGVIVRNASCLCISKSELRGRRQGKLVWVGEQRNIAPRSRWAPARTRFGGAVQQGTPDRLSVVLCTEPDTGFGLSARYPSSVAGRQPIGSAFVFVDCEGRGGYLRVQLQDGTQVDTPLDRVQMSSCKQAVAEQVARAAPAPAGSSEARKAAGAESAEFDEFPFARFRVRNKHASKRIVRAVAKPNEDGTEKASLVHTQVGTTGDTFVEAFGGNTADGLLISLCVSDGAAVQAWSAAVPNPANELHLLKSADVTLEADGTVTVDVWRYNDQDLDDEVGINVDEASATGDPCPRLQSFTVLNNHSSRAVVRAKATPLAAGVTSAAFVVDNVAHSGGTKTTNAAGQEEAQSIDVEVCLQGLGASLRRRVTTNNAAHRIKTITATVAENGGQPTLTVTYTLWDTGGTASVAQLPNGSCPLN